MTKIYQWGNQKPSIEKGRTLKASDSPIVSFGHSIVCPFSIEGFWLPHWYILVIALSVPFQLKASDYPNTMTKIYKWGNQKPSIEKGETILWPKDTNGVIRSLQLKRDRQYYDQNIPMGQSEAFDWKATYNTMTQLKASDYLISIFWS
jgi:hypothetical protein